MKITFQGEIVEATEVRVLTSDEYWNEYQLADGRVLMFKEVLVSVHSVDGRTNPDGTPVYQIATKKVLRVK